MATTTAARGRSGYWVSTQVINTLKDNLPAQKVVVDAAYGDSIKVPEPHTNSYVVGERKQFPHQFPMIFGLFGSSDISQDEARYEIERWDITLAIMHASEGKEDILQDEISRLVQTIQETILANYNLGDLTGSIIDAWPYRKRFGSLLTDGQSMLEEAQVGIRVAVCPQ